MTGRRERLILRRIRESGTKSSRSLPTLSERGAGGAITPISPKTCVIGATENSGDTMIPIVLLYDRNIPD
jgi:hypothetical protein